MFIFHGEAQVLVVDILFYAQFSLCQDIDPDVYDQPFQEPGSTPAAIYNQLSGQAYRHIPAVHVSSHEKIGSGYVMHLRMLVK